MGQNPPHAATLTRLMRVFATLFGLDFLRIQAPIALNAPDNLYTEPEPDVVVTREAENVYASRHPGSEDLRLVIEVSDTTLRTDLLFKARLYARSGIAEYWALDLNGRQLYIHRQPVEGEYSVITVHAQTETVALAVPAGASLAVAALLPPVQTLPSVL